jgi:hypothetical protein
VRDVAADVGFDQMKELGDRRRETHHAKLMVEKESRDLRAFAEILQVAGRARQLLHAVCQFAVDRRQLLVDRLQLSLQRQSPIQLAKCGVQPLARRPQLRFDALKFRVTLGLAGHVELLGSQFMRLVCEGR